MHIVAVEFVDYPGTMVPAAFEREDYAQQAAAEFREVGLNATVLEVRVYEDFFAFDADPPAPLNYMREDNYDSDQE